jgi:hypothetical protein
MIMSMLVGFNYLKLLYTFFLNNWVPYDMVPRNLIQQT